MPPVGLGCWMGTYGGAVEVEDMVKNAVNIGYRKFDTANTPLLIFMQELTILI
jgi:glycerol 2-dehydrogenase (NADP+)